MDDALLPAFPRERLEAVEEDSRQVRHASAEPGVDPGRGSAPIRHALELLADRSPSGVRQVEAVEHGEGRSGHHHAALPSAVDAGRAVRAVKQEVERNPLKRLLHDHGEVGQEAGHPGDDEATGPRPDDIRERLHLLEHGARFLRAVINLPKQGA